MKKWFCVNKKHQRTFLRASQRAFYLFFRRLKSEDIRNAAKYKGTENKNKQSAKYYRKEKLDKKFDLKRRA